MSPFDIFDPKLALNPTAFTGEAGVARLMDAAAHFPGGAKALVFALFWAPVGPGIPAGVLLARHIPLPPIITFGLYAITDLFAVVVCHPLFVALRRHGRKVPTFHAFGRRLLQLAMLGVPRSALRGDRRLAPALLRIGTVGFGVDIYTGGLLATGLPNAKLAGWAAALTGDLLWFALLLASSIAAASIIDDDRFVGIVVIVAMIVISKLGQRLFPEEPDVTPS